MSGKYKFQMGALVTDQRVLAIDDFSLSFSKSKYSQILLSKKHFPIIAFFSVKFEIRFCNTIGFYKPEKIICKFFSLPYVRCKILYLPQIFFHYDNDVFVFFIKNFAG